MENNFRHAPKLYIEGAKGSKDWAKIPMDVMSKVFQVLDGKNGNAIKIMMVLLGTKGTGSFSVTEKFITTHTGMTKQSYHRTMHDLAYIGFLKTFDKSIYINLDEIRSTSVEDFLKKKAELKNVKNRDDDSNSNHDDKQSNHDDDLVSNHDDDYNREKQRIKQRKTDSNALFAEGSLGDDPTEWPDEYYGL